MEPEFLLSMLLTPEIEDCDFDFLWFLRIVLLDGFLEELFVLIFSPFVYCAQLLLDLTWEATLL